MICKEGGKESLEVTNASEVSNENKKSKKCSQKGIVKVSQYTFVCEKKKNKNTKGNENRREMCIRDSHPGGLAEPGDVG